MHEKQEYLKNPSVLPATSDRSICWCDSSERVYASNLAKFGQDVCLIVFC